MLKSFKLNKALGKTFLIDVLTVAIIILLFLSFGKLLTMKAYDISGGKSVDQLKLDLISNLENSQEFLSSIKIFTFLLIFGTILTITLTLFLFSYSRALVWSTLLKRKFSQKRYWKWNLITLVLAVFLLLYLLLYALVRILLNLLIPISNLTVYSIYTTLLTSVAVLIFLLFMFLIYYSFAHKYKVWESVGNAFNLIKIKWKKLGKILLLALGVMVGLSVLLYFLAKFLIYYPWLNAVLNGAVLLLFLSWLRIYFFGKGRV